ncbi:MAG TPA: SRPBCC family protein [Candidatus Nitrosopolaris sp.]|nr:SRPBCC family protein [Candidatus Nitrosopolaris sp.]
MATPARVWRALVEPHEVVAWDGGVTEALDAPPDYPRPGQHVRWRFPHGLFRILHDRPREVVSERVLRSSLALGPFRFEETYTLTPRGGGSELRADLAIRTALLLVGGLVDRLYIGPRMRVAVTTSLRNLKRHCEAHP